MRLVAYCEAGEFGGAERSLQLLLSGLDADVDVTIVAVDGAVAERLASVRPKTAVYLVAPVESKRDLRGVAARVRLLARLRPHIFHASLHTPWTCQSGLLAALVTPGTRVVAVEQLPLPSASAPQRAVKRVMSRRLDAHVAVGDGAARLIERYVGLPEGTVETIHNGVPDERIGEEPDGRERPLVGAIGRLVPEKGFDLLIRAAAMLPDVDVAIVGEGPERPRLEGLIAELGLADRVELRGAAPDARAHLPAFDLFVLPSRHEGFPLAIVEAMLAGIPVVATDVGAIREAVVDGSTGVLLPPEDVGAIVGAVKRLLADPAERDRLAGAGYSHARERFTDRAMVASYAALYRRLVG